MDQYHIPVLLQEVIANLKIQPGQIYIDCTVGGGGHSEAILKNGGKILGLDQDPQAIAAASKRLASACPGPQEGEAFLRASVATWQLALGNFSQLAEITKERNISQVAGILFDLGVSSHQLETADRGFSFTLEGPLDMRMSPGLKVTAADLVNGLNEGELHELFYKLGGEVNSRRIAKAICRTRSLQMITSTNQLAEIISEASPGRGKFSHLHPATRCFQALRIAVNDELNNLKEGLSSALGLLQSGGRLLVISFHSGEDKIVKNFMKGLENQQLTLVNKEIIKPSDFEINNNPRCRSACLRVAQKI